MQNIPLRKELTFSGSNKKFLNIIGLEFKSFFMLSSIYSPKSSLSFFLTGFCLCLPSFSILEYLFNFCRQFDTSYSLQASSVL